MRPSEFTRTAARTASSPPDYGQPDLRMFNPTVADFVPSSLAPHDYTATSSQMETVQEVPFKDLISVPDFVPSGSFEPPPDDNPFRLLNHNAEEFQFSGSSFITSEIDIPPAAVIPEFKVSEEAKVTVPVPEEDISTSDDEEYCAENRPLRPDDESDQDSDFEEQPSTQPSIPHSPLRETSMQQHIYSPDFILAVRNDDASKLVPESITQFLKREVREVMEGKQRMNRYMKPPTMVRAEAIAQPDPGWRPQPTEEEKKIKEEAKKTSDRLTSVKAEDEVMKRTIKSTLNKLSPTNFDKLKDQLLDISKQNEDNLRLMAQGIFDKAWSQVKFTQLYANLCQYMDEFYANVVPQEPAPRVKGKTKKNV